MNVLEPTCEDSQIIGKFWERYMADSNKVGIRTKKKEKIVK